MPGKLSITLAAGEPFQTGEECPKCHFDSMVAILVLVNVHPRFTWLCGRSICRGSDA